MQPPGFKEFPFVSKVLKIDFIELATKVMLGLHPAAPQKSAFDLDYVGVKSSQFSFARLEEADPMLGVDMSSTGEVGCLGDDLNEALIKSVLSVGQKIPAKRILLSTGDPRQKADMLGACRMLVDKGAPTSTWSRTASPRPRSCGQANATSPTFAAGSSRLSR